MSVGGICVVLVVLVDVLRFFLGFPPDCDPEGTLKLPPTILNPEMMIIFKLDSFYVVLLSYFVCCLAPNTMLITNQKHE